MTDANLPKNIRPLNADDLARVVEIDAKIMGRSRRGFYEKRLAAALAAPGDFVYVGYQGKDQLEGFIMARLLEGEFGGATALAVLDAVAVDPQCYSGGIGRTLLNGLDEILRHKGIDEIQSQVDWGNPSLLNFLSSTGFQLAPRVILERDASQPHRA